MGDVTRTSREALSNNLARRAAVGDMLAHQAMCIPDKTALKFRENQYSYRELNTSVNRLAHGLTGQGIGKGDRVAVLSRNCDMIFISWFALMKIGAVMVPVNWLYKAEEVQYIVNHSEVGMIIAEDTLVGNVQSVRGSLKSVKNFVCISLSGVDVPADWIDIETLMTDDCPSDEPEVAIFADDLAVMIYSSGTESAPKGVMITHLNVMASLGPAQHDLMIDRNIAILLGLPAFHSATLHMFFWALCVGGKSVVLYLPNPKEILEITQAERINYWTWVTTLYVNMLQLLEERKYDLSSLRTAMIFGSYVDLSLLKNWKRQAPDIRFISGYGQSECAMCSSISGAELERRPSSVGQPFLSARVMIEGPEGEELPSGQAGEIVVRSPWVMLGYFKDEEKTAHSRRNGWHHTGDIGKLDDEGYLYFVNRVKDMIKTGGENVSSTAIEEVILAAHPNVAEVAVIGLPHPVWQEAVTAIISPKPGKIVTSEEIIDYCKEKIAAFKVPKKVIIREVLPKSNVGKILKRELRQIYAETFKVSS